jgi:hypothetical protein
MRGFNSIKDVFSSSVFSADFLQVIIRDSYIATFIAKHWPVEADKDLHLKSKCSPPTLFFFYILFTLNCS